MKEYKNLHLYIMLQWWKDVLDCGIEFDDDKVIIIALSAMINIRMIMK